MQQCLYWYRENRLKDRKERKKRKLNISKNINRKVSKISINDCNLLIRCPFVYGLLLKVCLFCSRPISNFHPYGIFSRGCPKNQRNTYLGPEVVGLTCFLLGFTDLISKYRFVLRLSFGRIQTCYVAKEFPVKFPKFSDVLIFGQMSSPKK